MLESVDEVAKAEGRSRANVIVRAIQAGMVLPRNQEPIASPRKMIIARQSERPRAREIESPKPAPATPQRFSGCPECGGINGMHQKKCPKR